MKKVLIVSILLFVVFLVGCDSSNTPTWVDKVGELTVTELNTGMDGDIPYFYGTVKNTGNIAVYNTMITFKVYETKNKNTIVDTTNGFPGNLTDIEKGESAIFEARAYNLDSIEDLQYYTYEITFLER